MADKNEQTAWHNKESHDFSKRIEGLIREEKKNLIIRETITTLLSPITSILAPWTSQGIGYLAGYAGVRLSSAHAHGIKPFAEETDYRRIGNKLFSVFSQEAVQTMPEIEREAKDANFLRDNIQRLSNESVRFIRSKIQLKSGFIGLGISLLTMAAPTIMNFATLGATGLAHSLLTVGGIVTTATVANLGLSISVAERRRREIRIKNKRIMNTWRKSEKAKLAALSNPALHNNTFSGDKIFQNMNQRLHTEFRAFHSFNQTAKRAVRKTSLYSVLINAALLGFCYKTGMGIVNLATLFMGINVMNSSIINILDAHFRLKETRDSMYDQYKKFRHNPIYDLQYGNKKIRQNADTICLQNICYCHRYNGKNAEETGKRSDVPVIQSDQTILFGPGIHVLGGGSGAGKSTLYKLFRHADDLSYGTISYGTITAGKFSGGDLTEIPRDSVNQHIAFCFQEIENDGQTGIDILRFGNPYLSLKQIETVASSLRLSLYKETAEGGREPKLFREMSGGEKKRVLFLQAFLSPKNILIFDEPTSGVDPSLVPKMLEMLNNDYVVINGQKKKRTIIYTTHHPEELKMLSVSQIIDMAPIDGREAEEFTKKHGTDHLPSQFKVYPFQTPAEKEAYLSLAKSRNQAETNQQADIRQDISGFISMSIAMKIQQQKAERIAQNNTENSSVPILSKSESPLWYRFVEKNTGKTNG